MAKRTQVLVSKFYQHVAKVTLVTSVLWVIIAIFNAISADYPADVKPEVLTPLSPKIDTKVVERIKGRTQMQPLVDSYVPVVPEKNSEEPGL